MGCIDGGLGCFGGGLGGYGCSGGGLGCFNGMGRNDQGSLVHVFFLFSTVKRLGVKRLGLGGVANRLITTEIRGYCFSIFRHTTVDTGR